MAPRGNPRKPRLKRMDAAVDAMVPFGFPPKLVRERVNNLLKEYGGDDGWRFIEADAYRLLIDVILDEQEEQAKKDMRNENEKALLDENAGGFPVTGGAKSPGLALKPGCSLVADAAVQTTDTEGEDHILPANNDEEGWKDIGLAQHCDETHLLEAGKGGGNFSQGMVIDRSPLKSPTLVVLQDSASLKSSPPVLPLDSAALNSPPPILPLDSALLNSPPPDLPLYSAPFKSLPTVTPLESFPSKSPAIVPSSTPVNSLPTRSRKPCYGWISSDEEDDDFIVLPPLQPKNMISRLRGPRKKRTRWDVRTEDV